MGLEKTMMKRWMEIKSPDAMAAMMKEMMPLMMDTMGPEGMTKLMPEMMEGMFDVMKPERMMGMMHETMPKMMDHCFSQMDETQQRNMLAMCRASLDEVEAKHLSGPVSGEKLAA